MYFNKNDSYSSGFTSILSMILVLFFISITIIILVPIFKAESRELRQTSIPLSVEKYHELNTCPTCITLTVEDSINLIDGFQYVLYEKNDTLAHCDK